MYAARKREINVGTLEVFGVSFKKIVRINQQCTQRNLRLDPLNNRIIVTSPRLPSSSDVKGFIADYMPWIERKVKDCKLKRTPFSHGTIIPILGQSYRLIRVGSSHSSSDLQTLPFLVPEDKFQEAVIHYLKSYASRVFSQLCHDYADKHHVHVSQVRIKDTKTRWGSCNSQGIISLSWRLIFAPHEVASYVCAHEVSHLKEMNHSPLFWKQVKKICPDYLEQKNWLKENGKKLYYYG